MTQEEFNVMVESMHHSGLNDDQIMAILCEMFESKKCSIEDLELMVSWLGYELSEKFYKDNDLKRKYQ